MKQLLLILFIQMAGLTAAAQPFAMPQTEGDTLLNVVAYFAKNDTMSYVLQTTQYQIAGNDTTVSSQNSEEFMVVVRDTLADGYRLELIPMAFTPDNNAKQDFALSLRKQVWELTRDLHVVFTTDEMGEVQRIENWRELRDAYKQGLLRSMDSIYTAVPGLDSIVPRNRIEAYTNLAFAKEEGIRNAFTQLDLLFSLHGKALPLGVTQECDTIDYPTTMLMTVGFAPYDEYGTSDDYNIMGHTVTHIPREDAGDMLSGLIGMIFQGKLTDEANRMLQSSDNDGMVVTRLEDYYYFFNGWPAMMHRQNQVSVLGHSRITDERVEWIERSWQEPPSGADNSEAAAL